MSSATCASSTACPRSRPACSTRSWIGRAPRVGTRRAPLSPSRPISPTMAGRTMRRGPPICGSRTTGRATTRRTRPSRTAALTPCAPTCGVFPTSSERSQVRNPCPRPAWPPISTRMSNKRPRDARPRGDHARRSRQDQLAGDRRSPARGVARWRAHGAPHAALSTLPQTRCGGRGTRRARVRLCTTAVPPPCTSRPPLAC